jgi:DNA helicase-2/ATP-dependent DNA helicase PcrA
MNPAALAAALDTDFRATCARLDLDEPYLGTFTLTFGGKAHEYKLGAHAHKDERIVDWRHPLSRAYYEVAPGEEFELDAPGFVRLEGVVERRCALGARGRRLRTLELLTRDGKHSLTATEGGFAAPAGQPARATHGGLGDLRAWLTPEQYGLIAASRTRPLIIQGRAGSGKTSVAMHRVAWLTFAPEDASFAPVDPARVLVVMFNKALTSFVRTTLAPLGLERVKLDTFHGWALEAIRRGYAGNVEPETDRRRYETKAKALKKHVGMLTAIDELVARQTASLDAWLAEKLAPYKGTGHAWLERWRATEGPLVRRLLGLRAAALAARDGAKGVEARRLDEIHKVLKAAVTKVTLYKEELLKLLTDVELLAAHLSGVERADLEALAAFQREVAARDGSDRRPGPYVRFEDFALLLRLMQRKTGGLPDKDREDEVFAYDHLVLDEAQDFGAVELAVILGSVRSRTGVTIVGDLNQKIVPDADFIGWDALAAELGIAGATVTRLEVAHRSTRPIMALADALVGDASTASRDGATPTFQRADDEDALLDAVAARARAAIAANPQAHVCVVTREVAAATALVELLTPRLRDVAPVRRGHNKEFVFAPGVTVTNFRQVKGLEFDAVLVVEPSAAAYPDTAQGRRDFYTLVTRARDTLELVGTSAPCSYVAKAIDAGLILADEETVPTADLGELDQPL